MHAHTMPLEIRVKPPNSK